MHRKSIRHIYFNILPKVFIFSGIGFFILTFLPVINDEFWYGIKIFKSQKFYAITSKDIVSNNKYENDSIFARLISTKPIKLEPVNEDFSIIIEKVGINAPIVAKVPVSDSKAYNNALKAGVAHALISDFPSSKPGNVYLFAHASINFWELGKYATTFNLLRKVTVGDRIHVFYEGKVFIYQTINKEILPGWNTYPLTRPVIEPILTLQTCDPPGTTINRLVITAKLIEVK